MALSFWERTFLEKLPSDHWIHVHALPWHAWETMSQFRLLRFGRRRLLRRLERRGLVRQHPRPPLGEHGFWWQSTVKGRQALKENHNG